MGLVLETLHFQGTYLSLAVTLPPDVARGLTAEHILTLDARLRRSPPGEVFLRLNLRHGPNTAALTRQPPWGEEDVRMAFDLAAMRFDPGRITGAWIDVIFDRPAMTRCEVDGLRLSRRLRAAL
jgi:hypothetical protein